MHTYSTPVTLSSSPLFMAQLYRGRLPCPLNNLNLTGVRGQSKFKHRNTNGIGIQRLAELKLKEIQFATKRRGQQVRRMKFLGVGKAGLCILGLRTYSIQERYILQLCNKYCIVVKDNNMFGVTLMSHNISYRDLIVPLLYGILLLLLQFLFKTAYKSKEE